MKIGFCGYSYHTQGYSSFTSRLDAYLFRLQTEGVCEAVVKGKKIVIEKGDLLLVKPGDQYELLIEEGQNSGDYHLFCEGDWIDKWWERNTKPTVARIDLDEKLLALWRHLIAEDRRPPSEKSEELSQNLLRALCLTFEQMINEKAPSFSRPYVVTRMMRYIEEHATASTFKVEEVARDAKLSVSRSVHLFKNHVGKTMLEYAQEIRMKTAIDQMKYTTMTLDRIAENCGFGTYSYFHRVFKKQYGVAPGKYRRLE
ncbi:AraC family transcriptional regulator [Aquibacillus albus]|uniref:AraC family transcriptional regulator of arabinose operon n=1 Tax=Aquibacillus albus TaxID=1168171 RepID=A0ABS2MYE0_9BACI|nr:AraC family transcriptional regulator [Aquibacillus albus]MBM7570813.1 AraC family transcriptional regulator of arabinose operon [Aquibacillus albus]